MIIHTPVGEGELNPYRKGIPTASAASKLITPKGAASTQMDGYARDLAYEILGIEKIKSNGKSADFKGNPYTEAGHDMEPEAAAWYSWFTGAEIERATFVSDDDISYGCTPDYFVGDGKGLLQLKYRQAAHLMYQDKIERAGGIPWDDYPQLQFELMTCEDREYNDILYYHDELDPFICHVPRDEEFIGKLRKRVTKCIEKRNDFIALSKSAKNLNQIYLSKRNAA